MSGGDDTSALITVSTEIPCFMFPAFHTLITQLQAFLFKYWVLD